MYLSRGDARTGLSILQQEERIEWGVDSQESMRDLLGDWQKVTSSDGKVYYHNTVTNETSWTKADIQTEVTQEQQYNEKI